MKPLLLSLIACYRTFVSPLLGVNCRFLPTCSEYCSESLHRHGVARGLLLGAGRVLRCHPWGGNGFDPVPPSATTTPRTCG